MKEHDRAKCATRNPVPRPASSRHVPHCREAYGIYCGSQDSIWILNVFYIEFATWRGKARKRGSKFSALSTKQPGASSTRWPHLGCMVGLGRRFPRGFCASGSGTIKNCLLVMES